MSQTNPSSRRQFLGQAGKTIAAAVGLAMVPGVANAATGRRQPDQRQTRPATNRIYTCCVSTSCYNQCGSGRANYLCSSTSCPSYCTGCQSFTKTCYSFTSGNGCLQAT